VGRNKRPIELDLKTEEARQGLLRLGRRARGPAGADSGRWFGLERFGLERFGFERLRLSRLRVHRRHRRTAGRLPVIAARAGNR